VRTLLRLISLFAVAVVAGCPDEPLAELRPDIAVDPAAVDFGAIQPGVVHEDVIDVGNRGTGNLVVRGVRIEPDDAGFTVVASPTSVGAGRSEPLTLRVIVPVAGPTSANLIVASDDEDTPELRVPLTAEGGVGHLFIAPDPIVFGRVNEGPGATVNVVVENDGLDNVVVDAAAFVDAVGFDVDTAALPQSLAPRAALALVVSLRPDAAMVVGGPELRDTLRLTTSIGPHEVVATASVNLAPIATVVERDTRRTLVKVGVNDPVIADGAETIDPEGDAFTYSWSVAERPPGSVAAVVGQGQPQVRVTPDVVGRYLVRLRATDVHGAFREADLTLLPRDLAAVLTWTPAGDAPCLAFSDAQCAAFSPAERQQNCCGQSDLDVHLIAPGGVLGDYGACPGTCESADFCAEESDAHVDTCRQAGLDCSFANRFPEWGVRGRADDPRLDIDDVSGAGPEVISLNEPQDGIYRVVVHYCLDRNVEPSLATLTLFEEGEVMAVAGPQRVEEGGAWIAAILERSGGVWGPPVIVPDVFDDTAPADLCSQ
jgi:hypothetical protein